MQDSKYLVNGILAAKISATAKLTGKVQMPVGYEDFKGGYEVTPKIDAQTLPTKDKLMRQDLEIKAIPYYEVSNEYGGTTIIIGGE